MTLDSSNVATLRDNLLAPGKKPDAKSGEQSKPGLKTSKNALSTIKIGHLQLQSNVIDMQSLNKNTHNNPFHFDVNEVDELKQFQISESILKKPELKEKEEHKVNK